MDTIQNAELKEAFDEFDKVGHVAFNYLIFLTFWTLNFFDPFERMVLNFYSVADIRPPYLDFFSHNFLLVRLTLSNFGHICYKTLAQC